MTDEPGRQHGPIVRNLANFITVMRLLFIPFVIWFIVASSTQEIDGWHYAALFSFLFAAGTDFLDGQIARRTDTITEFGKMLDPLADRLLVISVLVALMAKEFMPLWMGILVISRDVLMLLGAPIVGINRQEVRDRLAVHWTGKLATALIFTSICVFLMLNTPYWINSPRGVLGANIYGFILFMLGVVFSYASGFIYVFRGIDILKNLDKKEPA